MGARKEFLTMKSGQIERRLKGVSIKAKSLSFSYGEKEILDGVSFVLDNTKRNCLVGKNGVGKSTLLKILAREIEPSGGKITTSNPHYTVEYVPQIIPSMPETVGALDFLLQAGGLEEKLAKLEYFHQHLTEPGVLAEFEEFLSKHDETEIYRVAERTRESLSTFVGLSSSNLNKPVRNLSGGQKTRLFILQALASQPDLLLLDEPDNNLDRKGREWLIEEIMRYPNTLLVVGHRIEFADQIAERIFELSDRDHKIYTHTGSYSSYLEIKAKREVLDEKEKQEIERERKRIRVAIQKQLKLAQRSSGGAKKRRDKDKLAAKYKSGRATKKHQQRAAQLRKRLEELPEVERQRIAELKIHIEPARCGRSILTINNLSKDYKEDLFRNFSLTIEKGDHIAISGPNASGKTTLLKIIAGLVKPDEGEVNLGKRVVIGYFPQEHEGLPDMSVLSYFQKNIVMDLTSLRRELHYYLFTEDEIHTRIKSLSAGERARLFLVQFALNHANLLLLDEPTNNLDPISREKLAQSLADYSGTVFVVSHDRDFLERLSIKKTLRIGNGKIETKYGLAI